MKKFIATLLALSLIFTLCACGSGSSVSVIPVSLVNGGGSSGFLDRCAGKVVSGETAKVKKDSEQKVLEVYVKEGDTVKEGDKLFEYDAAAIQLELDKLELELKTLENTITAAQDEIKELEQAKSMVYITNQLTYTIRIDSKNADIREAEYNKGVKAREIETKKAALEATEVFSPLSGRVMSVADDDSSSSSSSSTDSSSDAFITIMDISHFRIQGHINELNLGSLSEGMRVRIISRTDRSQIWYGVVSMIDWENPVRNNSDSTYYTVTIGGSDETTTSSKYPFYIELDSAEGLVLGQHVVIEPDYGQGELGDGIWLPSYYISDADSRAWVWAVNGKDKLEKRSVTLGEYNADTDLYQILSGLELTDYIAMPAEDVRAGSSVIRYGEQGYTDESSSETAGEVYAEEAGVVMEESAEAAEMEMETEVVG